MSNSDLVLPKYAPLVLYSLYYASLHQYPFSLGVIISTIDAIDRSSPFPAELADGLNWLVAHEFVQRVGSTYPITDKGAQLCIQASEDFAEKRIFKVIQIVADALKAVPAVSNAKGPIMISAEDMERAKWESYALSHRKR